MDEATFLHALRALPLHPAARGLGDDTAVLGDLVLTTDTLVEGIHFLSGDPAGDVAWKLVATNLSDLAAKGATPVGVLLNYPLGVHAWDRGFLDGLGDVLRTYDCPVLGGDTVTLPSGAARILTITAVGRSEHAPSRGGARAGDALWVTGTIGDAGAGLAIARGGEGPATLLARYRRPTPRLAEGRLIARTARAMMDVSDGLLIDAARMAAASGLAVAIDLAGVPLSDDYRAFSGDVIAAVTAGDDYELLFATAPDVVLPASADATRIGVFRAGSGLALADRGRAVPLPPCLGFVHRGNEPGR